MSLKVEPYSYKSQTQAIDHVHRSIAESKDDEAQKEGKTIVETLAALKYEMQHDRKLMSVQLSYIWWNY